MVFIFLLIILILEIDHLNCLKKIDLTVEKPWPQRK